MGPYLVAVLMEEASNVRMVGVYVDFADSDDVCSNIAHMAEVIENVEAIVTETKTIDILEVDPEDIVRFCF